MFYQGSSEIHPDGLQTLYLMNPNNYVLSYSPDTSHFNPGPSAIHAPPPQQFMGFPLDDSSNQDPRGRIVNHAESVIMGPKYLKAAQELLDEVVSVGKRTNGGGGGCGQEGFKEKAKIAKESISTRVDRSSGGVGGLELTSAQRLGIQMKKSTLNSMLDEVDQRCKQYHQQMQMILTSFEQVAGTGSAKSYTHLALKTIWKQFSCLKNTISTQMKALSKTLGEEENPAGRKMDGSRLRFVDQQQRALRQLGMMQNNNNNNNNATSWRPQRCLPEGAVLLLRAWLFEHFLHPYPKDSDKQMLAKQTGLTKSQVSNWFINARVRLWKPMVEDMYLEETKSQEHINPNDNTIKPDAECMESKSSNLRPIINNHDSVQSMQNNKLTLNPVPPPLEITKSSTGNNMENPSRKYPKKRRNENQENSRISILSDDMETETGGRTINKCVNNDNITFISANQGQSMGNYLSSSSGYGSTYGISIAESDHRQHIPSGFQGNNNFSLSLAPPPSETYSQKHSFLSHGNFEFGTRIEPVGSDHRSNGINQAATSHPNISNFEILDFQLLHDHHFVA